MTSTTDDTSVRFHPDIPAIVCGECGFRTARIASVVEADGHDAGTVVVCLPCRERERARNVAAARRAALPARPAVLPRQRRAPAPRALPPARASHVPNPRSRTGR